MTIEKKLRAYAKDLGPAHCALLPSHLMSAAGVARPEDLEPHLEMLCAGDNAAFRKDVVIYMDDYCIVLDDVDDLELFRAEGAVVDPQSGEYMAPGSFEWRYEYAVL